MRYLRQTNTCDICPGSGSSRKVRFASLHEREVLSKLKELQVPAECNLVLQRRAQAWWPAGYKL